MPQKIISNFTGRLTRDNIGDMNSGLAKYATTFGNDPFSNIGNLTWMESPTQIDSGGTVITDLIMAARPRLEGANTFVYAIGDTGRLYKIQVNDSTTKNPNYDTATLLTTLTVNSPTFGFGASLQFFGTTERLYIGYNQGVTRVDFDGTNETFVGVLGSYATAHPGCSAVFLGKLYYSNGTNLVEIDSTGTVTTYSKLSPAFPTGSFIRDIAVSPDGNYLQIAVCSHITPQINTLPQDGLDATSAISYLVFWNGIDAGYTSFNSYGGYSIGAYKTFGSYAYTMGQELNGAAIYAGNQKEVSLPKTLAPLNNAVFSTGNLLGFGSPEYSSSVLKGSIFLYGKYDNEMPSGLYRLMKVGAISPETDIVKIPVCLPVTTLLYGESFNGYTNNQTGAAKIYYSTFEALSSGTTKNRFYTFTESPTGSGTAIGGVYETQQETSFSLFRSVISKKFKVTQVRFYVEPLVANNSFKIDLIGSNGSPISGGSQTFTVGTTPIVAGQDYVWYTPATAPTYSVGVRITNLGTVNWVGVKLELDYEEAGI